MRESGVYEQLQEVRCGYNIQCKGNQAGVDRQKANLEIPHTPGERV